MSRRQIPLSLTAILAVATAWTAMVSAQDHVQREALHVAFTSAMFADVNVNDAKAAIGVWADSISSAKGLRLQTSTEIFDDVEALGRAMDERRVHLAAVSVAQYQRLKRPRFGTILLGGRRGRYPEDFLLLVKNPAFTSLASLKGRRLVTVEGFSYDMSVAWLETALLDAGLGAPSSHFGTITKVARPARAVLPVFFDQQDACLISRHGYELMAELNPQLGRTLVPLAVSPPFAHAIMLLDRRYAPKVRADVVRALVTLHETPRGQQVLSMFGIERTAEGTEADLVPSLELLARLERLRASVRAR